jgi:hypothetical protein
VTAPEENGGQLEQRSSVKLTRNAKGDCQIEVKVYAGEDEAEVQRIREVAQRQYIEAEKAFYGASA